MANPKTKEEIKNAIKDVKWSNVITNIQSVILEGLARHKYLTLRQMLELEGIGTKEKTYLWKQADSLKKRGRPLINSHSFGSPQPKKGKVENMYYLLPQGKKMLIEQLQHEEEDIKLPIGRNPTMAYKDYHHRKRQIDFWIVV